MNWSNIASRLSRLFGSLATDRSGGVAVTMCIAAVSLVGVGGLAVDYAKISAVKSSLQNAADTGALAGAKEFRLNSASTVTITNVAQNFAYGTISGQMTGLQNITISAGVDNVLKRVTVSLGADQPTYFMSMFGTTSVHIDATATASINAGPPICVIGLDQTKPETLLLDTNAALLAPGCSIFSNSNKMTGLTSKNGAKVVASLICSAGGKANFGMGSFTPDPTVDCPVMPDPLANRSQPTVGACTYNQKVVSSGTVTLNPGVYCEGLTIKGTANVKLNPGIYIMKDGPFLVTNGGTVSGTEVGIFFTGSDAILNLDTVSNVSLSAPVTGDMAGILMFEDRAGKSNLVHLILSNNARTLLGTIYLPRNRLHIGAGKPVADQSAYTIVVVNYFTLASGPTMVLNINYDKTNVPVPIGLGPNANHTVLTQ